MAWTRGLVVNMQCQLPRFEICGWWKYISFELNIFLSLIFELYNLYKFDNLLGGVNQGHWLPLANRRPQPWLTPPRKLNAILLIFWISYLSDSELLTNSVLSTLLRKKSGSAYYLHDWRVCLFIDRMQSSKLQLASNPFFSWIAVRKNDFSILFGVFPVKSTVVGSVFKYSSKY